MIDVSKNEKILREALNYLRRASSFLRLSEKGNEPYRVGKAINMMGKTIGDEYTLLSSILGDCDYEKVFFEVKTHARKLIEVELEDNPSLFRRSAPSSTKEVE